MIEVYNQSDKKKKKTSVRLKNSEETIVILVKNIIMPHRIHYLIKEKINDICLIEKDSPMSV